jgi:hypothetical protein
MVFANTQVHACARAHTHVHIRTRTHILRQMRDIGYMIDRVESIQRKDGLNDVPGLDQG